MERIDTYLPQVAREQTRVVEVVLEPGEEAHPVALVEYFDDHFEESAVVEAFDLQRRDDIARFRIELGESGPTERVERIDETAGGLDTELMRAIVESLLVDTDYVEQLNRHRREFLEAIEEVRNRQGPPPEAFEGVGRNDPCPCESGRKYKKCCLRRRSLEDEYSRHDLSVDDFHRDWQRRSEPLAGVNQLLQGLWAVLTAGERTESLVMRLLGDLGVDANTDAVVDAVDEMADVRDFPDAWRDDFDPNWTWQRPLVEAVLPVLAELIWELRVPERPRPHRIKSCIGAGYQLGGEPTERWRQWTRAFDQLHRWIDHRNQPADDKLPSRLDEALELPEGIDTWLVDLVEAARQRVGEDAGDTSAPLDALEVLSGVDDLFRRAQPEIADDAAVFRYAGLLDISDHEEAYRQLERLHEGCVDNERAALYLCDLFVRWDFEAPREHLGLIADITDRALEKTQNEELRDAREQFEQLLTENQR